jgi:transcriptional regulator of arginine metabolism
VRLAKNQRQHRIARLLSATPVGSQAQLVALLAAEGVEATQTTVSRDLEELGALKVRLPGGDSAYALPELPTQQVAPAEHLRRVLGEWAVEITASGNLVLLRTPPGCAHVVASALDRSGLEGVLGTVAGDDTLLVVVAEGRSGRAVAGRLAALAGLATPGAGADRDGGGAGTAGSRAAARSRQAAPKDGARRRTAPSAAAQGTAQAATHRGRRAPMIAARAAANEED